jgi:hypothetical protein
MDNYSTKTIKQLRELIENRSIPFPEGRTLRRKDDFIELLQQV